MCIEIKNQHPIREEAIKKLKIMMDYPGRFPILVIGDAGTGKTHWIEKMSEEAVEFKGKIKFLSSSLCQDSLEFWTKEFSEADMHFLVIEEVEKLSNHSQELVFEAISTKDGLYGFEEKDKTIRLIFTTTFPIAKIRDDRRYLSAKFFDRISQFVVEFPNFERTQTSIQNDFNATWKKMFDKDELYKYKCPNSKELVTWLESEAYRMYGNFRDLDKIVINWNLLQLHGKDDVHILKQIKDEFKQLLHNPSQKIADDNTLVFDEDLSYYENLCNFRKKIKNWAVAINSGNKDKAATNTLKISKRTMERWT